MGKFNINDIVAIRDEYFNSRIDEYETLIETTYNSKENHYHGLLITIEKLIRCRRKKVFYRVVPINDYLQDKIRGPKVCFIEEKYLYRVM